MSVSIYLATAFTGRTGYELWTEYIKTKQIYERYGIHVVSPVEGEGIGMSNEMVIDRSNDEMFKIWKQKDKAQIRSANVFVYIASKLTSQGVMEEYRYSRGSLWKPAVGIFAQGLRAGFITRAENDYVATSHQEAALVIAARWGTWWRRVMWRLNMLNRSVPKFVWLQLKEFAR